MIYTEEKIDKLLKIKNFVRLEPFKNVSTLLLIKCLKDGYIWRINLSNMIRKNCGCPRCTGHEPWTNEKIDDYLIKNNRNIKRLNNFSKNCCEKMEWECLIDGYKWVTSFSKIFHMNHGCHKCAGNIPLSNDLIDKFLLENKRQIKRIGDYKNNKTKIEWQCLIDKKTWEAKPDAIMMKNRTNKYTGCPECRYRDITCNQKKKLTNEKIDKILIDTKRPIIRLGDYLGHKDAPIEWQCLIDGHKWTVSPGNVLNNKSGCPICKHKNEKRIKELIPQHIQTNQFLTHKCFKFNNRRYIVDFYIENLKNKKIIIEYNGQQHYYAVEYFGGETQLLKQQKRDQELREYCSQNDITLLEIPYHMSDEDIIKELNILNTI